MIPVLESTFHPSPHYPSLSHLAGRLCPFLLALTLAALAQGCAPCALVQADPGTAPEPEPRYRVILPGEGASSLKVGIPMGQREIRAGKISVILEWSTAATECAVRLATRVASREGHGRPTTEGEAAGVLVPNDESDLLWAGGEPGETYLKPYILELRTDALHGSGEMLTLEFSRDAEASGDTCETDLLIAAVRFGTGTKMAAEALHLLRDDRSKSMFGKSKVRTATIKPR